MTRPKKVSEKTICSILLYINIPFSCILTFLEYLMDSQKIPALSSLTIERAPLKAPVVQQYLM